MPFDRKTFSKRINYLIYNHPSKTLTGFANKCSLHHSTVANWRTGKSTPQIHHLAAMAEAGIDLAWLILGEATQCEDCGQQLCHFCAHICWEETEEDA